MKKNVDLKKKRHFTMILYFVLVSIISIALLFATLLLIIILIKYPDNFRFLGLIILGFELVIFTIVKTVHSRSKHKRNKTVYRNSIFKDFYFYCLLKYKKINLVLFLVFIITSLLIIFYQTPSKITNWIYPTLLFAYGCGIGDLCIYLFMFLFSKKRERHRKLLQNKLKSGNE